MEKTNMFLKDNRTVYSATYVVIAGSTTVPKEPRRPMQLRVWDDEYANPIDCAAINSIDGATELMMMLLLLIDRWSLLNSWN
jgi:hypothetical protein